jgi:hypothetical protein
MLQIYGKISIEFKSLEKLTVTKLLNNSTQFHGTTRFVTGKMPSSGMLRCVVLVSTDVSEEFLRSVRQLLVTANVVPGSWILVTLMTATLLSSETSVLTRARRSNIPDDGILHSHNRETSTRPSLGS